MDEIRTTMTRKQYCDWRRRADQEVTNDEELAKKQKSKSSKSGPWRLVVSFHVAFLPSVPDSKEKMKSLALQWKGMERKTFRFWNQRFWEMSNVLHKAFIMTMSRSLFAATLPPTLPLQSVLRSSTPGSHPLQSALLYLSPGYSSAIFQIVLSPGLVVQYICEYLSCEEPK